MTASKSMFMVIMAALALGWAGSVAAAGFPATGQTTCYNSAGTVIPCAGTGQDGAIQAGATLNYRDRGNGTIEDRNTGLVWEKKSDDAGIHDRFNAYTWVEAFDEHVAMLNNSCANDETVDCSLNGDADCVGSKCGFAGQRNWRVPNVKELQSIVNYENVGPAVSTPFNTNCTGATVLTGSCTAASGYWSSTTFASAPDRAWGVGFFNGDVSANGKNVFLFVRAVRGGSP